VFENLPENQSEFSVLVIKQYPMPIEKLKILVNNVDEIIVIEEGYPYIEEHLNGFLGLCDKPVRGKLTGDLPRMGELNPDSVRAALRMQPLEKVKTAEHLAGRPPQLCVGCPHADTFKALNEAMKDFPEGRVFSDIGCYTLGALPPYRSIESCVDMGASISMANGAAHAGIKPSVCAIGDSTFTHSGMTPLLDAADIDSPITVFIMDNSTTAMTGGQPSYGTGDKLADIVRGLGVSPEHIVTINPISQHHDENVAAIKKELGHDGLSVILARRPCIEELKRRRKQEKKS
jgi:indolepyruvate ferredoxin oxidoreductase alpha subunit